MPWVRRIRQRRSQSTRKPSTPIKYRLKEDPYCVDLFSKDAKDRDRFMTNPHRVGDVELQVVELYGEPGDVYLVDMRVLHAQAPNASQEPRIMLTHRWVRQDVHDEVNRTEDTDGRDAA